RDTTVSKLPKIAPKIKNKIINKKFIILIISKK
ncbi:MAG: hypothetical protein Athens071416_548, partial [Parcubacteria group bacterium Athens0714_16]